MVGNYNVDSVDILFNCHLVEHWLSPVGTGYIFRELPVLESITASTLVAEPKARAATICISGLLQTARKAGRPSTLWHKARQMIDRRATGVCSPILTLPSMTSESFRRRLDSCKGLSPRPIAQIWLPDWQCSAKGQLGIRSGCWTAPSLWILRMG